MPHRYHEAPLIPYIKIRPFAALREKWKEGYKLHDLKSDLMAGMIVGVVAIPLGMALAIATGVPPQQGLYTSIVGGAIVALLGGSRFQITGPTAAFVVILVPIVQKFGISGLLCAGLLAGIMLVVMGACRLGRLIEYIPYTVTTGFTVGIAVVIATLELKDFFGLHPERTFLGPLPETFLGKAAALLQARGTFSPVETTIGVLTLLLLVLWPKLNKKIPAPLIALTTISVLAALTKKFFPQLQPATIGSYFTYQIGGVIGHGIPQTPPLFQLPWKLDHLTGPHFTLSLSTIQMLIPPAFAITMLGAIESLLSAVVADGLSQTKHDPDAELVALGVGNIVCPFLGGIPATGAISRTAANIRYGAKSPLSGVFHALFTLVVVLALAPYVSYLPMSALAALLILVAYNMAEVKHFIHVIRVAPKSDVLVLLACTLLTILFDMVIGVSIGITLAALLLIRKVSQITSAQFHPNGHPTLPVEQLPQDTVLYEIEGPLFFGAAEKAIGALDSITDSIRTVIFIMDRVPAMDVTGLVAFESAIQNLVDHHRLVILTGVKKQPAQLLARSGLLDDIKKVRVCHDLKEAYQQALQAAS